jgi:signal transduction histidine kinase
MPEAAIPPAKDALLSQGAHEVRNPTAVILGYLRMLTSGRFGPITDGQRKIMGEMAVSATRLAVLADQMSLLAQMVAGGAKFDSARVDLGALIATEIPAVHALQDRVVEIKLTNQAGAVAVTGDPRRLRQAFHALIFAHRREAGDELCVFLERATLQGRPAVRITFAASDQIAAVRALAPSELSPFVAYRGGIGYSLALAQQVILTHGGELFCKVEPPRSAESVPVVLGAVVLLPEA